MRNTSRRPLVIVPKVLLTTACLVCLLASCRSAQPQIGGLWDAGGVPNKGEIPLRFEIAGNWEMFRTAPENSKLAVSWRLYLRQSGSEASGAILKTSGDSGSLTGRWDGGKLVMSHFAGERPLLFEAQQNPDGTLAITL